MAESTTLKERIDLVAGRTPAEIANQVREQLDLLEASNVAPGLAVGEQAPRFTLPNRLGAGIELYRELVSGPVVLSFLRGSWCPICTEELKALREIHDEVRELGAEIIAVSPQSVERNIEFGEAHNVNFYLLSDVDQRVIKEYKLHYTFPERLRDIYIEKFNIDVSLKNADGSWALPVPATFIISQDGTIYSRQVEMNYLRRMEPEDILTVLRYMR